MALTLLTLCVPTSETTPLPKHQRRVLRQILTYVLAHPNAKDTLEGIHKWWGLEGRAEFKRDRIQKALKFLMSRGWVTEREVTPTPRIYGVNKEQLAEIKAFLQTLEPEAQDGGSNKWER